MLRVLRRISLTLYPKVLGYSIIIGGGAIGAHQYMKRQTKSLEVAVYKNMEKGSKPPMSTKNSIPREDIEEEIKICFFPDYKKVGNRETDKHGFGIMVGPMGSGKTTLVLKLCNEFPQGVLYYHAMNPEVFCKGLAEAAAMKISPSSIFDLILGYFSSDYFMYYRISEEKQVEAAIRTIFGTLETAANKYKSEHGRTPTLFLDGMDILAKWNAYLFKQLVYEAKVLANADILTVVFVSSEGLILPLVQKMSEVSRCSRIIDVGDISDEKAINYLKNNGLPRELGEKIVQFTGGRFAYLVKCAIQYHTHLNTP